MQTKSIPALCRITSEMSRGEMREKMRLAFDCGVFFHDLIIYMDFPTTTDSQGREIIDTSGSSKPTRRKIKL